MHRTEGHPSLNQGGVSDRKGKVVKRTDATCGCWENAHVVGYPQTISSLHASEIIRTSSPKTRFCIHMCVVVLDCRRGTHGRPNTELTSILSVLHCATQYDPYVYKKIFFSNNQHQWIGGKKPVLILFLQDDSMQHKACFWKDLVPSHL